MGRRGLAGIRVCLCMLAGFLPVLTASAREATRRCWIENMVGDVKVRRGSSPKWVAARPGMLLKQSDAIRTFVESEAILATGEGSKITLNENATLELSLMDMSADGARRTDIKILSGSIMANVKKLVHAKSKFELETPTAVAAIRGTKVGLGVTREKTEVRVYEGKVFVTPKGSRRGAELQANQMAAVVKGQRKVIVTKIDKTREVGVEISAPKSRVDTVGAQAPKDTTGKPSGVPVEAVAVDTTAGGALQEADTTAEEMEKQVDTTAVAADAKLMLMVATPEDGNVIFPGGGIVVAGSVAPPKAVLRVRGKPVGVAPGGGFSVTVPGPAEPGEYEIKVEAVYGGETRVEVRSFVVKPVPQDLVLTVSHPSDGQTVKLPQFVVRGIVTPGAEVAVDGGKVVVSSAGEFQKEIYFPEGESEMVVEVEATLEGKSMSETRTVQYDPGELVLDIMRPVKNEVLHSPKVTLDGRTMPGAELTVAGMPLRVQPDGRFSGEIPIPDEEGEMVLEFEANYGGKSVRVTRTVSYEIENIVINIVEPGENQIVCERRTRVKVNIRPEKAASKAEVTVDGQKATMAGNVFTAYVDMPSEPGEHEIEIEVEIGSKTEVARRVVRFEPASDRRCNVEAPTLQPSSLPPFASQSRLVFTVFDKTPLDEVTFHVSVDGSRDSETGTSGSRFYVDVEEGEHEYSIYAEDLVGNRSAKIGGKVLWLSRKPTIKMISPRSDYHLLHVPPNSPGRSAEPEFTVEFSVDNLPDDNYELLKEVTLTNEATGETQARRRFTDVDFDFDVGLERARNPILIQVRDVKEQLVVHRIVIEMR